MRKTREINFYKVIMIAIIISFSFLFAGVIGLNVEVKDVNNSFTTTSVSEGEGESEIKYLNWLEIGAEWNNYETQTEVEPSKSLTLVDGYLQINSLADWFYATSHYEKYPANYSLNRDLIFNDGYFDDDGTYHDGGDGVCYVAYPFYGTNNGKCDIKGNGHTIKGFYIDDSKMSEEMIAQKGKRSLSIFSANNGTNVSDLYIENIYLHSLGSGGYSIGSAAINSKSGGTITNVHILSGTLRAEYNATGFSVSGNLTNCTNKANIYGGTKGGGGSTTTAGIARGGTITNCINYGKVESLSSQCTSGIGNFGTIRNCKNYGRVSGTGIYTAGINVKGRVENCINYGEVVGSVGAQGIGVQSSIINECVNYGKIINKSGGWSASGIGFSPKITNCINYGDVYSNGGIAAGIQGTSDVSNYCKTIVNCKNYGNVTSSSGSAGGITGSYIEQVVNCINFGDISGVNAGGISCHSAIQTIKNCKSEGTIISKEGYAGGLVSSISTTTYDISFKDCHVDSVIKGTPKIAGALVGYVECSRNLTFDNCKIDINEQVSSDFGFVFGQVGKNATSKNENIIVKYCDIVVKSNGSGSNYLIINNLLGKLTLNGVIIKESKGEEKVILVKNSTGKETYESLIIETNGIKQAYGQNYIAYYIKWKTGEIGIKTIDGNGFFQGEVDKDLLEKRGFMIID